MLKLDNAILIISCVLGIYASIIIITRLFGLRTFAKMSAFDFISTVAVGSIIATVILSQGQGVLQGTLALFCIIGFQTLFSALVRRFDWFKKTFTNKPRYLMLNGEILHENLEKCNVDVSDLMAKLREANVLQLSHVQAVVFESTGDISVMHTSDDTKIDPKIVRDVEQLEELPITDSIIIENNQTN